MATGTIALDPSTPPVLGQPLNFIVTTDGLKGNQVPRVEIKAYDPNTNALIYGTAEDVTALPFGSLGFISQWSQQGGPAHCTALLYYFDNHPTQHQVALADLLEFDAAGS